MHYYKSLVMFLPALLPIAASAGSLTLDSLSEVLRGTPCYSAECVYDVFLPSRDEPVEYSVKLLGVAGGAARVDTLSPCDYLLEWAVPTPSGTSEGFSAYFEGSHFRYRDKRLQEYHADADIRPFAPHGRADDGVQHTAQFCELLPQFVGEKLAAMASDSTYSVSVHTDAVVDGRPAVVVDGMRRIAGYDCLEFMYVFDSQSLMPVKVELENNPGQISEQTVAVRYGGTSVGDGDCGVKIDLPMLIGRYNDAFEKYREDTFSLTTLPGRPLPAFKAYTVERERFVRSRNDVFATPMLVVLLDSSVGTVPRTVDAVRSALSALPMQVGVLWAFLDKRPEDVLRCIGADGCADGETVLMSAGALARDCGAGATTPVLLFCAADGTVADVHVGFNNELRSIVIQKASQLAMAL